MRLKNVATLPNARQERWMSFLSEHDFEIKHIKGKENKVVDTLSHHVNLLFARRNYEFDLENHILREKNLIRNIKIYKKILLKMNKIK